MFSASLLNCDLRNSNFNSKLEFFRYYVFTLNYSLDPDEFVVQRKSPFLTSLSTNSFN